MKKLIYSAIIFLVSLSAFAQENRGTLVPAKVFQRTVMVGGTLGGAYRSTTSTSGNLDEVDPIRGHKFQIDTEAKVGVFIRHDFAVGGRLSLNHQSQKTSGSGEVSNTYLIAGPFARYYLMNGFYGEGNLGVGRNAPKEGIKNYIFEGRAGVGYALFINPKVAFEPALSMVYTREYRVGNSDKVYTELGPSVSLGLQVYLFRERSFKMMR